MFHAWVGGPDKFRVEAMSGLSFAAMNASTDTAIQARVKQLVEGETLMLFDTATDPGAEEPHQRPEVLKRSFGVEQQTACAHEKNRRPADKGI